MPRIIVDTRESRWVVKHLKELGSQVIEETISPADYVVSEGFAVERKQFGDFLRSVFDGRLFEQAESMAGAYENSVLVVEGPIAQSLSGIPNPLVFWGALAKVFAEWGLSVMFTLNEKHTAMFLHSLAKKLQEEKKRKITIKHKPKTYTLRHIGPERAEKLLKRFGSLRRVFTASDKEFLTVEGLGRKTVQGIRELVDIKYPGLEQT